jgi:hypothetical protein
MFLSRSLIPLVLLTVIFSVGSSVLAFHGVAVPRGTGMLWSFTFQLILAFWVHFDRRVRGFKVPFEFDVFVFFAWPVLVPYYTYKTRGKQGLLLGAGVLGLFATPSLAAAIVKLALTK